MIGGPVFFREILANARRTRTYVFQTIFLAVLVLALIPAWPASGKGMSGAKMAERGQVIFMYGAYLQVILLALLAPAVTANAITEEKDKNSLDLLLLTGAGPFSIVWGKFLSRLFHLLFLLFLTLPLLFALLTLGGVSVTSILIQFAILAAWAVLGAGLGIFLSTIMPKTTGVLMTGYAFLALLLALPLALQQAGYLVTKPGTYALQAAYLSPFYDMIYLFRPHLFVATAYFPDHWWVCPVWCVAGGLGLVLAAGLLIPHVAGIERALSARWLLDGLDRASFRFVNLFTSPFRPEPLAPGWSDGKAVAAAAPQVTPEPRRWVGVTNPIYWKETSVNTIGRFKYWWRVNLAVLVFMVSCYGAFVSTLGQIEFHKVAVAVLAGLIVLLSTVIAATTVSQEREDTSLVLVATTPVECATYIRGKVLGIARNISFLVALPFLHTIVFVLAGVIHPVSILLLLLAIPVAVIGSIMQGIFVSLLFPTTLRAILAGVVLVILEATLPAVCCLPTFNLPLTCHFVVEPASGLGSTFQTTSQTSYLTAMSLALLFSAGTQLGYTVVVYSLIRSGFDRYIGRA